MHKIVTDLELHYMKGKARNNTGTMYKGTVMN